MRVTYRRTIAATILFIAVFYAACDRIPAGAALNVNDAVRP